jgi:hypothetical protein
MNMPMVYIAGPYRAPARFVGHLARKCAVDANIATVGYFGRLVADAGGVPLVPHAVGHLVDGQSRPMPDDYWLRATLEMMLRCDAVLLVPGWRASVGSCNERDAAVKANLHILDLDGEPRQYQPVIAAWIQRIRLP